MDFISVEMNVCNVLKFVIIVKSEQIYAPVVRVDLNLKMEFVLLIAKLGLFK
jgi:hypothetical protein